MARDLEAALDEGALGLSSGLEYPAEHHASREEIAALLAAVRARDGLYATHTRDRGLGVVGGTVEGIAAARDSGVRTQVSHILARQGSGGSDANARIADLLEEAATTLPIAWDVHTRLFGITNLSTAITPAILGGPADEIAWAHRPIREPAPDRAARRHRDRRVRASRVGPHVRAGGRSAATPSWRRTRWPRWPR